MHGCRPCIGVHRVSLFTREWIEIQVPFSLVPFGFLSPSLRGSGLKSVLLALQTISGTSPSLRGSGLKYYRTYGLTDVLDVSLFTREWIEITERGKKP